MLYVIPNQTPRIFQRRTSCATASGTRPGAKPSVRASRAPWYVQCLLTWPPDAWGEGPVRARPCKTCEEAEWLSDRSFWSVGGVPCLAGVSPGVGWFCQVLRSPARGCAGSNPEKAHEYRRSSLSSAALRSRSRACKTTSRALTVRCPTNWTTPQSTNDSTKNLCKSRGDAKDVFKIFLRDPQRISMKVDWRTPAAGVRGVVGLRLRR